MEETGGSTVVTQLKRHVKGPGFMCSHPVSMLCTHLFACDTGPEARGVSWQEDPIGIAHLSVSHFIK